MAPRLTFHNLCGPDDSYTFVAPCGVMIINIPVATVMMDVLIINTVIIIVLVAPVMMDEQTLMQGGRSCTGARVAPAEKFGLGRKF